MPWWLLPGAVGLLLTLGGGWFLLAGRRSVAARSRAGWHRVPGAIVDWEPVRTAGTHPGEAYHRTMFPVVEYPLPDGSTGRFRNPTTLDTGIYRTGPTTVLVDPADPHHAELETSGRDRLLGSAVLMVVGVGLSGFGIVVLAATVMFARALS